MIRAPRPCRVVFDGQSLANTPDPWNGDPNFGWPWTRIVMLGRELPAYWVAVGGTSMTSLASTFATRAAPSVTPAGHDEPTIYVLCGGTTDLDGEGDTGAQVYADAGTLAALARAAGAAYVVCTTVFPAAWFDSGEETQRQAANALILADAAGHFDGTVDFDVPGLDDTSDPRSYLFDGVHLIGWPTDTVYGTGRAAAVAAPAIDAAIAAVTP